jgi:uncharacterized membrane protein
MEQFQKTKKNPTVGNLFALIFLVLTSIGNAYAPDGFNYATFANHFYAVLSIVAGVNILIALG